MSKDYWNKSDWMNPCILISQISYSGLEKKLQVYSFLSDFYFLFHEQVPHLLFSSNQDVCLYGVLFQRYILMDKLMNHHKALSL